MSLLLYIMCMLLPIILFLLQMLQYLQSLKLLQFISLSFQFLFLPIILLVIMCMLLPIILFIFAVHVVFVAVIFVSHHIFLLALVVFVRHIDRFRSVTGMAQDASLRHRSTRWRERLRHLR